MKIQHNYLAKKLVKYSLFALFLLILTLLTYRAERRQNDSRFFQNELLFEYNAAFTGMYYIT